jgi:hypothetical protein
VTDLSPHDVVHTDGIGVILVCRLSPENHILADGGMSTVVADAHDLRVEVTIEYGADGRGIVLPLSALNDVDSLGIFVIVNGRVSLRRLTPREKGRRLAKSLSRGPDAWGFGETGAFTLLAITLGEVDAFYGAFLSGHTHHDGACRSKWLVERLV